MRAQKSKSESGQILVLLAVAFVALLAFVALAIDGGAVFLDRRSAQNAADAAALAGAYDLARHPCATPPTIPCMTALTSLITTDSGLRAQDNHYGPLDGKIVTVEYPVIDPLITHTIPASVHQVGSDTDPTHYVRVTITSTVNTSFLHFIFPGLIKNTVEAVAHVVPFVEEPLFYGSGLVSLAPSGCSGLTMNGDAFANLVGGGIFINSNDPNCAAVGGGSSFIFTPSIKVVGEILKGSNLIVQPGPEEYNVKAITYGSNLAITIPGCSTNAEIVNTNITINEVTFDYEYGPDPTTGTGIITAEQFKSNNNYFDAGIYCIDIGSGTSMGGQKLYGKGVLFHITGTNPCNLTFNSASTLELTGYKGGTLDGLLFYFDPNNFSPQSLLTFNGNEQSFINGTVYAPTCSIKLNGSGGNFYQGQLIGYAITMDGGAKINMSFVKGDNYVSAQPAKVDLTQ